MSALWRSYYIICVAVGVCSVEIVLYNGGSSGCLLCGDGII